jgi:hypothetical protein
MTSGVYKRDEKTKKRLTSYLKPHWFKKGHKVPQRWRKATSERCFKGGIIKLSGYICIKTPLHPFAFKNGYIKRSRLVMEKYLNRYLLPIESVHHIDGNKENDEIENLMLFESESKHQKYHHPKGRKVSCNV